MAQRACRCRHPPGTSVGMAISSSKPASKSNPPTPQPKQMQPCEAAARKTTNSNCLQHIKSDTSAPNPTKCLPFEDKEKTKKKWPRGHAVAGTFVSMAMSNSKPTSKSIPPTSKCSLVRLQPPKQLIQLPATHQNLIQHLILSNACYLRLSKKPKKMAQRACRCRHPVAPLMGWQFQARNMHLNPSHLNPNLNPPAPECSLLRLQPPKQLI
jgi:hypothetical protein